MLVEAPGLCMLILRRVTKEAKILQCKAISLHRSLCSLSSCTTSICVHHAKHWPIHCPGRSHDRQSQRPSSTIFAGGNLCLCHKRCPKCSQQPLDHRSLAVLGTLLTNEYSDIHIRRLGNEQRPSHAVSMSMGNDLGSYGE